GREAGAGGGGGGGVGVCGGGVSTGHGTVQDGGMRDIRAMAGGLRSAIERSGYYPGVVADAVSSALGSEAVVSYVLHHDAVFHPGMGVRPHITVLVLTPTPPLPPPPHYPPSHAP